MSLCSSLPRLTIPLLPRSLLGGPGPTYPNRNLGWSVPLSRKTLESTTLLDPYIPPVFHSTLGRQGRIRIWGLSAFGHRDDVVLSTMDFHSVGFTGRCLCLLVLHRVGAPSYNKSVPVLTSRLWTMHYLELLSCESVSSVGACRCMTYRRTDTLQILSLSVSLPFVQSQRTLTVSRPVPPPSIARTTTS